MENVSSGEDKQRTDKGTMKLEAGEVHPEETWKTF